jgi:hypothetical protein
MRSARREERQVFGYTIVRFELYDDADALVSRCYEVSCPRTAAVLGRQQSLRAARRFIVMHELRGIGPRSERERPLLGAARIVQA